MSYSAERSIGLRAFTEFPLLLCEGTRATHCRAVELSASGVVVERGRELSPREQAASLKLEMFLPGNPRPVRALAKVARRVGPQRYALRFVLISDVDRLSLMEHLDHQQMESLLLLDEVAAA